MTARASSQGNGNTERSDHSPRVFHRVGSGGSVTGASPVLPDKYEDIVLKVRSNRSVFATAERHRPVYDHGRIGRTLVAQYAFPLPLLQTTNLPPRPAEATITVQPDILLLTERDQFRAEAQLVEYK